MRSLRFTAAVLALAGASLASAATVTTNVDTTDFNYMAWGENVGWINFRGNVTGTTSLPPPTIGTTAISGFAWGENIGWINLGTGANTDPNAFGVIVNPSTGALSGYAWAENVGWINFGTNFGAVAPADQPKVNLANGLLTGFAWGENIGWINLNPFAGNRVQAAPPTATQIADGLIGIRPVPVLSDRQPDGVVNSADVVSRVEAGAP